MSNEERDRILKNFREMRLPVMAEQVLMMIETQEIHSISAIEALERVSEVELMSRKNNTVNRLKAAANLSQRNARFEEIDYRSDRRLNKSVLEQLKSNDYILNHRNVILLGACGTGKSYLANVLGNHACESRYGTYYCRLFEFLNDCNYSFQTKGSISEVINKYLKYSLLIIDDFLISDLSNTETNSLFQLIEYRHNIVSPSVKHFFRKLSESRLGFLGLGIEGRA